MKNQKLKNPIIRNPIVIVTLALVFTKGIYEFFCKTTTKVLEQILPILNKAKLTIAEFKKLASMIWIVNHFSNKLEGICSVSSSVFDNCLCKAKRAIKDCICSHCYAHSQQSYQTGLKEHNILNGFILRNVLIPVNAFKVITLIFPYLRIESFGDVANVTEARNYIRLIKAFPKKRCTIFSKNILIWEEAFQLEGKPNNTTYVHSSHKINTPDNIDLNRFTFIDHIFTVYTKKFAKENNIVINCGGKKCLECIMKKTGCFFKTGILYINELLKP